MNHFLRFVKPGARRIETVGPWTGTAVAFQNPDGTNVIVLQNPFKDTREANVTINGETYTFFLEKESFHTITW